MCHGGGEDAVSDAGKMFGHGGYPKLPGIRKGNFRRPWAGRRWDVVITLRRDEVPEMGFKVEPEPGDEVGSEGRDVAKGRVGVPRAEVEGHEGQD